MTQNKLLALPFSYIITVIFIIILLILSIPACAQPASRSELSKIELKKLLQNDIQQYHIPGAVLAVTLGNGQTSIVKAGDAQIKPQQAISDHQLFSIGSVTKLFTSVAIMQLVEHHSFSLDDSLADIAKHYPESDLQNLVKQYPHLKQITLKQVLNHTSGLHAAVNSDRFAKSFNQAPLI